MSDSAPKPQEPTLPELMAQAKATQVQTPDEKAWGQFTSYLTGIIREIGKHTEVEAKAELEQTRAELEADHKTQVLSAKVFLIVFVSLIALVAFAVYRDKEDFAKMVITTVLTGLVSGVGGYSLGKSRAAEN